MGRYQIVVARVKAMRPRVWAYNMFSRGRLTRERGLAGLGIEIRLTRER